MKILLTLAVAVLPSVSALAGENLVTSGGFEEFTSSAHNIQNAIDPATYAPWRVFCLLDGNTSTPRSFYAGLSNDAAEGRQAFSYGINASDDRGDCAIDRDASRIPVEPGATYKISFAAKDAGGCPQVVLGIAEWKKGDEQNPGGILHHVATEIYDLKPEYQTFSMTYTVQEGEAVNLRFSPFDFSVPGLPENTCTMLLDAVRMEKETAP